MRQLGGGILPRDGTWLSRPPELETLSTWPDRHTAGVGKAWDTRVPGNISGWHRVAHVPWPAAEAWAVRLRRVRWCFAAFLAACGRPAQ